MLIVELRPIHLYLIDMIYVKCAGSNKMKNFIVKWYKVDVIMEK